MAGPATTAFRLKADSDGDDDDGDASSWREQAVPGDGGDGRRQVRWWLTKWKCPIEDDVPFPFPNLDTRPCPVILRRRKRRIDAHISCLIFVRLPLGRRLPAVTAAATELSKRQTSFAVCLTNVCAVPAPAPSPLLLLAMSCVLRPVYRVSTPSHLVPPRGLRPSSAASDVRPVSLPGSCQVSDFCIYLFMGNTQCTEGKRGWVEDF